MFRKRARLRQIWAETRWILLGMIWLVGLALGYAGFNQFSHDHTLGWSTGDILYRTLQLILLESGSISGSINWMLETARFLLPTLTAFTALQAFLHLFTEQIQWLRLWRLHDHVIICGLGRKSDCLASELLALGQRVVMIEKKPLSAKAIDLQQQGVIFISGDATDQDVLSSARPQRARHLICLLGEDRQNLQVAFQAYHLTQGRRLGKLTCILHLSSPDLLNLIKRSELTGKGDVPFQLETFNPYARTAQLLLQQDPDWQEAAKPSSVPTHILVSGLGRLGEHLILQTA
ncbi:MAG: NAD-binding protein [Anaerolineaceae bacterium]|nr:NAD-binding protein [Anaerolineaceae bacterium]